MELTKFLLDESPDAVIAITPDGKISLCSEFGKGSIFTLTLAEQ